METAILLGTSGLNIYGRFNQSKEGMASCMFNGHGFFALEGVES